MTLGITPELRPLVTALDDDAVAYFLGVRSWVRATAEQTGGSMGIVEQELGALQFCRGQRRGLGLRIAPADVHHQHDGAQQQQHKRPTPQ